MNWLDELYETENGRQYFVTTVNIVDDDLDITYLTNDAVHKMVDLCVGCGVKVGTA